MYLDVLAGESTDALSGELDFTTLRALKLQVLVNDLQHSTVVGGYALLQKLERKRGMGKESYIWVQE